MTILEFVEYVTNRKIYLNRKFIRISFYEFRSQLTQDEMETSVELSKIRLENLGYKVYLTGDEYFYNGELKKVENNELLIAIKKNKLNEKFKENIDKIHTTKLGIARIKKNLKLDTNNVVEYCKNRILDDNCHITRQGKNYYCQIDNIRITINANNYSIITAHVIE